MQSLFDFNRLSTVFVSHEFSIELVTKRTLLKLLQTKCIERFNARLVSHRSDLRSGPLKEFQLGTCPSRQRCGLPLQEPTIRSKRGRKDITNRTRTF